jgi:hypothetical protein
LIFVSIARGVTGVDPQTGHINWELDLKFRGRTVASPVLGAGLVFAGASGYAFQMSKSREAAGVGHGIFIFNFDTAQAK